MNIFPSPNQRELEWRLGAEKFGYTGRLPGIPRGLVIGEAPGASTDPRLPLWPDPPGCAGARLMEYSGATFEEYVGRLRRVNQCVDKWDDTQARHRLVEILVWLTSESSWTPNGETLRVVLLGRRVATAWGCSATLFGLRTVNGVEVAWIPHPSGRNLVYNDRDAQLKAGRVVKWAMGARRQP